jgi:hypothetical protein
MSIQRLRKFGKKRRLAKKLASPHGVQAASEFKTRSPLRTTD